MSQKSLATAEEEVDRVKIYSHSVWSLCKIWLLSYYVGICGTSHKIWRCWGPVALE